MGQSRTSPHKEQAEEERPWMGSAQGKPYVCNGTAVELAQSAES